MTRIAAVFLTAFSVAILLQGCAAALFAGAATSAGVIHDRRTAGSVLEDNNIELKAFDAMASDPELSKAHVSVTSYNQIVLLSGEAPSAALRARAEKIVSGIAKVRRVHDEIVVGPPTTLSVRASDTWITTKVKTDLLGIHLENFDPTRVKVVTENGTVYLMGLVTRQEADAVVDSVRQSSGVRRVVKIFEYIG